MTRVFLMLLGLMLIACSNNELSLIESQKDDSRCSTNLDQHYSYLKNACVWIIEEADIKLDASGNNTFTVYVIFSEDKAQAEVFALDLPENTILDVVKGGYLSKDGNIRLMKTAYGWRIQK